MAGFLRRFFAGGGVTTSLANLMTSGDTTFNISSSTGWPGSPAVNFGVVIDRGTGSEEKILCSGNAGAVVTVATRGVDGTSATGHNSGASVSLCALALDFDESNQVSNLLGNLAEGSLVYGKGTGTIPAALTIGTTGKFLTTNGTDPSWAVLTADATKLSLTGGTMSGAIAMGAHKITGITNGSASDDAAAFGQITAGGGVVANGKEVAITTGTTVATYTPGAAGNFLIAIYFRVITATTNVTITVTWTDVTGAQTLTPLSVVAETTGSYTLTSFMVNSAISQAITVAMTAGTSSQVLGSATITQG